MTTLDLKEIAKTLRSNGMQCNCDLDNWEPDRSTGHSHVCRIHKVTIRIARFCYNNERVNRCFVEDWEKILPDMGPREAKSLIEELTDALELLLRAFDSLLPGAKTIPIDLGLLNEAAMKARPLVESLSNYAKKTPSP